MGDVKGRPDLYLASTSPRRRELLQRAGLSFALCEPGPEYLGAMHEHEHEAGEPIALARDRARRKVEGATAPDPTVPMLAVDTVVDLDGVELGKPRDRDAARSMLLRLAGRQHRVHTAHCLLLPATRELLEHTASAVVACRQPSAAELERYLASEQWRGKAGGYGIQDPAQSFLTVASGSFDTVVGLSVAAVRELLERRTRP
jgi:septum formation protein